MFSFALEYNGNCMMAFLVALIFIICICLVLLRSFEAPKATLSWFELNRRSQAGDKQASFQLQRNEMLLLTYQIKPYKEAVLVIALVAILVFMIGQARGVATSLLLIVVCSQLTRLSIVKRLSRHLVKSQEGRLVGSLSKHQHWLKRLFGQPAKQQAVSIGSKEELMHLISTAGLDVLSADDKQAVIAASSFGERQVSDVMINSKDIVTVKQNEVLGPLVLSDLHKTGHSRFPVVKGDINNIVGVLDISSLLTLEVKKSVVAKKAMSTKVLRVKPDNTLKSALGVLVGAGQQLMVVVDEADQTIGLVSLDDIIQSLTGESCD